MFNRKSTTETFFEPKTITVNGCKLKAGQYGRHYFGNDYIEYTGAGITIRMHNRTYKFVWYTDYLEVNYFGKNGLFRYNPLGNTVFFNNLEMSPHFLEKDGLQLDELKINFNARKKTLALKIE